MNVCLLRPTKYMSSLGRCQFRKYEDMLIVPIVELFDKEFDWES